MLYHDSFYRFVNLENPKQWVSDLRDLCMLLELKGTILVAQEGLNGMLAGSEENLNRFWKHLNAQSNFESLRPKRTQSSEMPFKHLKIKEKKELVPLGIPNVDAVAQTGVQVSPEAWRTLIQDDNVILIDNRNSFEFELGTFKGAINPQVRRFRDFADYVLENEATWKGKKIAMFCTGGIRCEKASSWMMDLGFDVYQLEGGILNYFAQVADAEKDFTGECFVFDGRELLSTHLQETRLH
ncbi:MAG: rhodanese-like domain-containing protein [Deinococcaceae bacterium]